MSPRPPADAVVALRSLERRYRSLFLGLEEDESPDDLAHRPGPDGTSALDHVVAATRTLTFLGRALEQALVESEPVLHPAVADPSEREWPAATGTVKDALDELAQVSKGLAARVEHVSAKEWGRAVRVAGHDATTTPLDVLWDATDTAVTHLKAADAVLRHVREEERRRRAD